LHRLIESCFGTAIALDDRGECLLFGYATVAICCKNVQATYTNGNPKPTKTRPPTKMLAPHFSSMASYTGSFVAPAERTTPNATHINPAQNIIEYGISIDIAFSFCEVKVVAPF
jgi:hypothetical protein